jgi:hypothetical protein
MKKIICGLVMLIGTAGAQVSNPSIISVATAPSGSCSAGLPNQQVVLTGTQYSCQNVIGSVGTWASLGGGGGSFAGLTGDALNSGGTSTATEVVGLLNNPLPTLATGFLNWTGTAWALSSAGSGTVTSIATAGPITGGTITTTGTIACATCVSASSPGAGIAHFAGSTQAVTSSPVSLTADVSGLLPVANGGTGTTSPSLVAGTNITSITGTWPNQTINAATQGTTTAALTFNNSAAGAASGTSFNGATAQTISTNTINAAALGVPNTFNSIQFLTNPSTASISDLEVNMPNLATGNIVTEEIGVASTAGNSMFIGWNKTATNAGYGEWSTFSSGMPLVLLDTFTSTNSPMSIDNAGNSGTVAGFTCAAGDAACFGATANGTRPAAIGTNGAFISNVAQTTVSCSTSGSAIFSQPMQGASDKKVLIHMAACLGTASYTYPVTFTNTPSIYASNNVAASIATAVSTTAVTVTGATTTGSLVLEDF